MSTDSVVNLTITNNRASTIYLYFSNTANAITGTDSSGNPLKISAADGTAEAYTLQTGSSMSCSISDFASGRVGFSLGQLTHGDLSEFNNANASTNGGDYTKRFDKFELNVSSGSASSDLTALDWLGLPFTLATSDSSSAVASGGWTEGFSVVTSTLISDAVVNTVTNENGSAIVTGDNGVTVKGFATPIVRIIGPNTAIGYNASTKLNITPYQPIADAVAALSGLSNPIVVKGAGYSYQGGLTASGNILLTSTENSDDTIEIDASDLTSIGVYGANPQSVSVNGGAAGVPSSTSIAAACRDVYAGFNLGAWGSTTTISIKHSPFNGKTVGQLNSQELRAFGSSLAIKDIKTYLFSGAQPNNPSHYNEYAERVCHASSNSIYGFPYSDFLGGQLITASPTNTLTLTVLGDS